MKKTNLIFTVLQVPIDGLVITLALVSAYLIRSSGRTELFQWPFDQYLKMVLISLPVWIIIFFGLGLYRVKQRLKGFRGIAAIAIGILASWALFVVTLYFIRTNQTQVLPRLIVFYSLLLTFVYVTLTRGIIHLIQQFLYKYKIGTNNVLMIKNGNSISEYIINSIENNYRIGYHIVKIITAKEIENIEIIFKQTKFDEIISTDPDLPDKITLSIIDFCETHNIPFKQIPNLYEVRSGNVNNTTFLSIPIIEYTYTPLQGWGRVVKRLVDIIGSALAIIIFSPLMFIIAVAVKLDSNGPVFYKHKRVGMDEKTFYLYKFRSMKIDADEELQRLMKTDPEIKREFDQDYKLKKDPRVTRIGKITRKISIDELPQIFNVFLGQMSLVGPRPIIIDEMEKYGIYKLKRHIIKPGMTGLWQVSGRNNVSYNDRIKFDSFYIENWSLWLDLSIIIKTFTSIVKKNTY